MSTIFPIPNRLRTLTIAALALFGATAAEARQCRIPRALLCEGCASVVTLRVGRDGTCIVSAQRHAAKQDWRRAGDLIVRIRPIARPIVVARAFTPHRSAGRCFVFQDRRYCE